MDRRYVPTYGHDCRTFVAGKSTVFTISIWRFLLKNIQNTPTV